jgi:hypothetical protein
MCSTPRAGFECSVPPSPIIPPVPRVSPASSISSLNSLYDLDERRQHSSLQYPFDGFDLKPLHKPYGDMSDANDLLFTDEDLAEAFQDHIEGMDSSSPRASPNSRGQRLAHDISDPSSPWKRSIRVRYSDMNMRQSNVLSLREASDLLSRDMSSYVLSQWGLGG